MATLLDVSTFSMFVPIFSFLLIFFIIFALLGKSQWFGESSNLNAVISFCIALLFLFIPQARKVVEYATPWFVVLVLFSLFIILMFLFMGIENTFIVSTIKESGLIVFLVFAFIVLIFLTSLGQVFGPSLYQGATAAGTAKAVIFNPKVMAVVIILLIGSEAVRQVGYGDSA